MGVDGASRAWLELEPTFALAGGGGVGQAVLIFSADLVVHEVVEEVAQVGTLKDLISGCALVQMWRP